MAKAAPAPSQTTSSGRKIITQAEKPVGLVSRSGPGRTRQATEFDDLVPEWYQSGEWVKIPAEGDTVEAQLEDIETVYKAVNRAVQHHELGCTRVKEDDPEKEGFQSYGVWVHVRDRQQRPRKQRDADGNVIENDPDQSEFEDITYDDE